MASNKRDHITYHKATGLYQARYMVTFPDGTRKRQAVYGRTKEEAREKYNQAVAEGIIGTPLKTNTITVEQYLESWLALKRNIRESTRYKYGGEIRKYIVPRIGKMRLSCLTNQHIQRMLDDVYNAGASTRTVQILRNILSGALKVAKSQNLVRHEVMEYIEIRSYDPKPREIWTEQEMQVFLRAIVGHKYQLLFLLYTTYGLRRGEALSLTWGDVDWKHKVIYINKQYTYCGKKLAICDTKTKKSVRDLPLLPHIENALLALKGNREPSPDSLLVSDDNGGPIKPSSVSYEFNKIVKETGLPRVVLHSQRHFVATTLKDAGVTATEAQEILGHSSSATTLQFYTHSSMQNKEDALLKYAEKMQF